MSQSDNIIIIHPERLYFTNHPAVCQGPDTSAVTTTSKWQAFFFHLHPASRCAVVQSGVMIYFTDKYGISVCSCDTEGGLLKGGQRTYIEWSYLNVKCAKYFSASKTCFLAPIEEVKKYVNLQTFKKRLFFSLNMPRSGGRFILWGYSFGTASKKACHHSGRHLNVSTPNSSPFQTGLW